MRQLQVRARSRLFISAIAVVTLVAIGLSQTVGAESSSPIQLKTWSPNGLIIRGDNLPANQSVSLEIRYTGGASKLTETTNNAGEVLAAVLLPSNDGRAVVSALVAGKSYSATVGSPITDGGTQLTNLRSASSGLYLAFDQNGRALQSGSPAKLQIVKNGAHSRIKDVATDKCLAYETVRGSRPTLATCGTATTQDWTLDKGLVVPRDAKGLALDVFADSRIEGAAVVVWDAHGRGNQIWEEKAAGTLSPPVTTTSTTVNSTSTTVAPTTLTGLAPTTTAASGGAMPTSDLPGFNYVGGVDFITDAPQGRVASAAGVARNGIYDKWILAYPDEWSGNSGGRYRFNGNATVSGGTLKVKIRELDGEPSGAAWIWKHPNNPTDPHGVVYGAFEQRLRVTGNVGGYGAALLLWPDSNVWTEGEIDFPEGDFSEQPKAFHHCVGNPSHNCSVFDTRVNWSDWHTYRIEWNASGTSYYVDGKLLGRNTSSVPRTKMHWVNQFALSGSGASVAGKSGTFEVDWARFLQPS